MSNQKLNTKSCFQTDSNMSFLSHCSCNSAILEVTGDSSDSVLHIFLWLPPKATQREEPNLEILLARQLSDTEGFISFFTQSALYQKGIRWSNLPVYPALEDMSPRRTLNPSLKMPVAFQIFNAVLG